MYEFREVESIGDYLLEDMTFRDLWYHFYRIYRVIQKQAGPSGAEIALSARAVFSQDTIEGYWFRRMSAWGEDPFIIPLFIRLLAFKKNRYLMAFKKRAKL